MIRRTFWKPEVHCAAEGCGTVIGRGKIFCLDHYLALPRPLRDQLWNAWRAAMDARRTYKPRIVQTSLNVEYQQAYQACRDYLETSPKNDVAARSTVAFDARDFADAQISGGAPTAFRYVEGRRL